MLAIRLMRMGAKKSPSYRVVVKEKLSKRDGAYVENVGFYKNARADALMESARAEMDSGKRLELYREIHRVLVQDPPADFLWGADQYWAVAKRVEGVEVSSLGLFHFLPGPPAWRLSPSGR